MKDTSKVVDVELPKSWKCKYRIVKDKYAGYECQKRYIFWPFWIQMGSDNINTWVSQGAAVSFINSDHFPTEKIIEDWINGK